MDQKKIGRFLRSLRNEKGLTQEQLAAHFNTTSRSVSRWETGSSLPDISLLVDLADFYDVDVRELIDGERKSDMMDSEIREVADKMADYAGNEKDKLLRFIQIAGVIGVFVSLLVIVLQIVGYEPDFKRFITIVVSFISLVITATITLYVTGILKRIAKHKKLVFAIKLITIIMLLAGVGQVVLLTAIVGLFYLDTRINKPVAMTDTATYNEYRNETKSKYKFPSYDMTAVLPEHIDEASVTDYQYTYYNPWDPQYILYMTVSYDEASYEAEIARLEEIGVEDYTGIYSVTGEPDGYDLVAMDSDSYNGFVYAMVPEGDKKEDHSVTYVMIFFYNYFLDLDINDYMRQEYLLPGFNAELENPDRQAFDERFKEQNGLL